MRAKLLALSGLFVVGAAAASGQAQRGPATLDDVVNEVRALRADLKATGAATTRTQMLTARLSLQEQRIAVLANQRADVAARLMTATRARSDIEAQVQRFESAEGRNSDGGQSRDELEGAVDNFKRVLAQNRDAERQLRAQEDDLSAQIGAEQGRWMDLNNRLDELERSLK